MTSPLTLLCALCFTLVVVPSNAEVFSGTIEASTCRYDVGSFTFASQSSFGESPNFFGTVVRKDICRVPRNATTILDVEDFTAGFEQQQIANDAAAINDCAAAFKVCPTSFDVFVGLAVGGLLSSVALPSPLFELVLAARNRSVFRSAPTRFSSTRCSSVPCFERPLRIWQLTLISYVHRRSTYHARKLDAPCRVIDCIFICCATLSILK